MDEWVRLLDSAVRYPSYLESKISHGQEWDNSNLNHGEYPWFTGALGVSVCTHHSSFDRRFAA